MGTACAHTTHSRRPESARRRPDVHAREAACQHTPVATREAGGCASSTEKGPGARGVAFACLLDAFCMADERMMPQPRFWAGAPASAPLRPRASPRTGAQASREAVQTCSAHQVQPPYTNHNFTYCTLYSTCNVVCAYGYLTVCVQGWYKAVKQKLSSSSRLI